MDRKIHIDIDPLASTLRQKLLQKSPWPAQCCIYRVPITLCRHNQMNYTPKLVSIGPYHNSPLQAMEKIKLWYLDCLLARAPTNQTGLECFVKAIRGNIEQYRQCYAEELNHGTDELVELMVVDGCFILELFRKYAKIVQTHVDDPVFKTSWMLKALVQDLLLLENQLPWSVLECLFNLTEAEPNCTLPELALSFFSHNALRKEFIKPNPSIQKKHLLDLQRYNLLSSFIDIGPDQTEWFMIPCVTELLQAGVQFKKGEAKEILNIQFNNGVMIIPPIIIVDNAESFIRNLIAFEQCDKTCEYKITSYAVIWDNLINSSQDLDFLRQQGIITCYLSTEDLSSFFNKLYNDAHVEYYAYAKVSRDVTAYCQARCPRWRVILIRDYFSNPWSIIALIGAIVVLILTFLQTIYSIIYH